MSELCGRLGEAECEAVKASAEAAEGERKVCDVGAI
jgi:hypothetical protein